MTLFGPSQEKSENPILTQFEPKSTSGACYGGWPIAPWMAFSPQNNFTRAENTPPIGLDGRGLGFEHPEIRLWCLFWQSVKWGAPSMWVMSENDIQRIRTTLTSPKHPSERGPCNWRQIPMCARGLYNFYLGLIGAGSSTVRCRNA